MAWARHLAGRKRTTGDPSVLQLRRAEPAPGGGGESEGASGAIGLQRRYEQLVRAVRRRRVREPDGGGQQQSGGAVGNPPASFSTTTNRISGGAWTYDTAGNVTADPGGTYAFDAENRMASAMTPYNTIVYGYDGDGRRVTKTICPQGTSASKCASTLSGTTTMGYVYDAMGQLAAEYKSCQSPASCVDPNQPAGTVYLTADMLGSTRQVVNAQGGVVECVDYLPFGDFLPNPTSGLRSGISCYGQSQAVTQLFTGQERDGETGLDYFGARYFSGVQGRFTTADEPFVGQDPSDPQSWNLYIYVRNNPLAFTDPTGQNEQGPQPAVVCDKDGQHCHTEVTVTDKDPSEAQQQIDRMLLLAYQRRQAANQPKPDVPLPNALALVRQPAIAALPVDCGGGVYGYHGKEVNVGPVKGFAGSIAELDSQAGGSAGGLVEGGGGVLVVGGVGFTRTVDTKGQFATEGLVYGGVGAETPAGGGSVGAVAFGTGPRSITGVGLYGEASLGGAAAGGGAYINLSSVGRGCKP